jgi:2',3'-cyclic-nucleotide 2'-phosphodiesterase (5'-nucleotidase family)
VHVFYTSDEHGWMSGTEPGRGAANLVGLWSLLETGPEDNVLILSGGDNWTGPDISSWYDGQSMVEVMNAMGYDAATVGNHELDFGLGPLQARLKEANYQYVSANIRFAGDLSPPVDLGIQPYVILDYGDYQVGITGLTYSSSLKYNSPLYKTELVILEYEAALREYLPAMREAGADLVFVMAHLCLDEIEGLAGKVDDLGIQLVGGGHCHELYAGQVGKTVLLSGGEYLKGYGYSAFEYRPDSGEVTISGYHTAENRDGIADPDVAEVVAAWETKLHNEWDTEIGYLEGELPEGSELMAKLFTQAWLEAMTDADLALIDGNSFQADLPAGAITVKDVTRTMPANRGIVELELTGDQIIHTLESGEHPWVGGMSKAGDGWRLDVQGEKLALDQVYTVLVNSDMYHGLWGYDILGQFNPGGYHTGIDARAPVIEWMARQGSTPENTLESKLAELTN